MGEDWDASAQAWIDNVATDLSRTIMLDPVMLQEAGGMEGLLVADIGCGEGRFARMLSRKGAKVVGLDPTIKLLKHALDQTGGPKYVRGSAESLPFAGDLFDLVVSYVMLIDVPDFRKGISEMARILKPGGKLLIANLNSFVTCVVPAWQEDQDGNRLFVAVDRYLEERPLEVAWNGIEIINWHRPLSAYMEALLSTGLVLKRYLEPRPSAEDLAEEPRLKGSDRVPYFHVMVWEKPA